MTRVADLAFAHSVRVSPGSPSSFSGMTLETAFDPATTFTGFVRYVLDGEQRYGYLWSRVDGVHRGQRWATALLYDIDGAADAREPGASASRDPRLTQRAELDLTIDAEGAAHLGLPRDEPPPPPAEAVGSARIEGGADAAFTVRVLDGHEDSLILPVDGPFPAGLVLRARAGIRTDLAEGRAVTVEATAPRQAARRWPRPAAAETVTLVIEPR